ncbi:nuclear transport factor 2 family protein [Maribacter sp. CXY002]|uniref:nuclear transport factor 2 family protein n=1 Tax=Maribacter luteocoastalis TaxID=3407671 RepID=UPI003B6747C2
MQLVKIIIYIAILFVANLLSGQVATNSELYQTIKKMDSVYFTAYNECDMEVQAKMYAEDLEFYHDKAGFATNKAELLESLKQNICGKVTRSLVEDSVEVHEIKDYGAVQIGMHKFYNNLEPNAVSVPTKFIVIWKQTAEDWQMSRIISLH